MRYHLVPDMYATAYFIRDTFAKIETVFAPLPSIFNETSWFELSGVNHPPILQFDTLYSQDEFNAKYPELFI